MATEHDIQSPRSPNYRNTHRAAFYAAYGLAPITMITMTWPQYRRSQCSIGDWTVNLSPIETELLSTLLIRYPNPVTINELIDAVYPDPDAEPEYPEGQIVQRMMHLARKIGTFRIDNCGRTIGYRLYQCPDDARAGGLKVAA